jgi:hypothetical protein
MLILNAPGFFTVFWGIIKQIIDPRTAKRIQVYSNKKKGLLRLRELIDDSEIPSDYGGSGPSIETSIGEVGTSGKKNTEQYEVKLLTLKKKGKKQHHTFHVDAGQVLSIRVYTRSASSAQFTLRNKEKPHHFLFESSIAGKKEGDSFLSHCTEVGKDIIGPGKFCLEAKALDDASKASVSRGHFLVVGILT